MELTWSAAGSLAERVNPHMGHQSAGISGRKSGGGGPELDLLDSPWG